MTTHTIEIELLLSSLENVAAYQGTSLSASETKEVDAQSTLLPHCIFLRCKVSSLRDPTTTLQDHLNQVVPPLAEDFLCCLMLLVPRPLDVVTRRVWCDREPVPVKAPSRMVPDQLYILAGILNRDVQHRRVSYVVRPELWPELEALFAAYQSQSPSLRKRVRLAMHWLLKTAGEITGHDRLVSAWIAFNSLYADSTKPERQQIEQIIHTDIDPCMAANYVAAHDGYISQLVNYPLERRRRRGPPIRVDQDLATELGAAPRDAKAIVKTLALCIYCVRNRLFHGNVDLTLHEDDHLSEIAEVLLCDLVRLLLFKRMSGSQLRSRSFIEQETAAF